MIVLKLKMIITIPSVGYKVNVIKETDENSKKYAVLGGEVLQGYRVEETTTSVFDRRPAQLIELYEFEGCPFCRKVREAVAILDLDVLFYPCPKGSTIYRPMVEKLGGKQQFPYMRDPNTNVNIYERLGFGLSLRVLDWVRVGL
jgi:glutaredoxin